MSLKRLAEGIILQSIEDLWNEDHRQECITFFKDKDFRICAELAGIDLSDQVELLNLVKRSIDSTGHRGKKKTGLEKPGLHEKRLRGKQLERAMNCP